MKRLPLAFLLFSLFLVSSCSVPIEPTPILPDPVSGDYAKPAPVGPSVETQPKDAVVAGANENRDVVNDSGPVYPFLGSEDAPVTVIEYGDFSDGTNSFVTTSQVASINRDYVVSRKVKLVFKPYPLSGTDEARRASEAAWCMWEQGSTPFWAYHKTLFAFYLHLDDASLNNYASRIPNADKSALRACLDSGKYAERVGETLAEGIKLGLADVPAFIIGNETLTGNVPYKELKAAIGRELGSGEGSRITGSLVFSKQPFFSIPTGIMEFIKRTLWP